MRRIMMGVMCAVLFLGTHATDGAAKQLLRVGLAGSAESDPGVFVRRFKAIAESLSGGALAVSIFADGTFGGDGELLDHLREGRLAVVSVSAANAASAVEELTTLALPGLVESHDEAVKATTGSLGRYWNEVCLRKGGFRILGWTYGGARIVSARGPMPSNPGALSELVVSAAFSEWWAEPGDVEGQVSPADGELVPLFRYYRMHPFVMGDAAWQRLSPQLQGVVLQAGREAQQYSMLMQALKPESRGFYCRRPAVTRAQIQAWVWPAFHDLLGGGKTIDATLDAINWK